MKKFKFYFFSLLAYLLGEIHQLAFDLSQKSNLKAVALLPDYEENMGNAREIPVGSVVSIITMEDRLGEVEFEPLPFERFCGNCGWNGFESNCKKVWFGDEVDDACPVCDNFVESRKDSLFIFDEDIPI